MKNITLLFIILLFSLSSCKKYDEGPVLSFKSKKERIANDWRVAQAINNGKDVTDDFERYEVTFTENGDARLSAEYTFLGILYQYSTEGTWIFEYNKEIIAVNYSDDDADAKYKILKLKEEELWLKEEGTDLEFHLIPR